MSFWCCKGYGCILRAVTPRPTPDSRYPYTRGEIERITDVGAPTIKNLQRGRVLRKRRRGAGNYVGYDDDDALRIMLSKVFHRVGLEVSGIHALFASLEQPAPHPSAKTWSWLRTREAYDQGAAIVLLRAHASTPSPTTGHAYLTTAADAVWWLQQSQTAQTVIVIDVGALILQLEARTGRPYGQRAADSHPPNA